MGYRCFDVSIEQKVAHIVLTRPEKRNSMIPEFWDELPQIVRDIDDGSKARAIVISSTGPHFTSGLDITAFNPAGSASEADRDELRRARRTRGASFYDNVRRMQQTFSCLEQCPCFA